MAWHRRLAHHDGGTYCYTGRCAHPQVLLFTHKLFPTQRSVSKSCLCFQLGMSTRPCIVALGTVVFDQGAWPLPSTPGGRSQALDKEQYAECVYLLCCQMEKVRSQRPTQAMTWMRHLSCQNFVFRCHRAFLDIFISMINKALDGLDWLAFIFVRWEGNNFSMLHMNAPTRSS